ncbi:MAG: Transcriptional regulator, AraC family, partial [uncultured Gemmatimonadaceae bacterium]
GREGDAAVGGGDRRAQRGRGDHPDGGAGALPVALHPHDRPAPRGRPRRPLRGGAGRQVRAAGRHAPRVRRRQLLRAAARPATRGADRRGLARAPVPRTQSRVGFRRARRARRRGLWLGGVQPGHLRHGAARRGARGRASSPVGCRIRGRPGGDRARRRAARRAHAARRVARDAGRDPGARPARAARGVLPPALRRARRAAAPPGGRGRAGAADRGGARLAAAQRRAPGAHGRARARGRDEPLRDAH